MKSFLVTVFVLRKCANALALMCLATTCGNSAAQVSDLTVVEAVWTTRIEDRLPVGQVKQRSAVRSLYFWTRLKGGNKALELLRVEGKLPIVHQWIHSTSVTKGDVETLGTDQDLLPAREDGRPLSAGDIEHSVGLAATANDLGTFRWRTWSHKESVWNGTWTVFVRYANGDPVLCNEQPCRWRIQVR
jgi:hypothetical protein